LFASNELSQATAVNTRRFARTYVYHSVCEMLLFHGPALVDALDLLDTFAVDSQVNASFPRKDSASSCVPIRVARFLQLAVHVIHP
jgi:hypothetical protein